MVWVMGADFKRHDVDMGRLKELHEALKRSQDDIGALGRFITELNLKLKELQFTSTVCGEYQGESLVFYLQGHKDSLPGLNISRETQSFLEAICKLPLPDISKEGSVYGNLQGGPLPKEPVYVNLQVGQPQKHVYGNLQGGQPQKEHVDKTNRVSPQESTYDDRTGLKNKEDQKTAYYTEVKFPDDVSEGQGYLKPSTYENGQNGSPGKKTIPESNLKNPYSNPVKKPEKKQGCCTIM